MTRAQKGLLIAGGYAAALLVASAAVRLSSIAANAADPQASAGMSAFGDTLLFAGVFVLCAIPPTGAALYFLRSAPRFWVGISVAAVAIATTAVAALLSYGANLPATGSWSALAPLRILMAPAFGFAFLLARSLAPTDASRRLLITATVMELGAFVGGALVWWHSLRS